MQFEVQLTATADGEYCAVCAEPSVVGCGLSPTNALDRLRAELRYQLELCPCSGIADDYIELVVTPSG
jgi:hypothetical protein